MILDRFRLDGKVAVVTGSGRGLGAAIAIAFAEAGADIVLSARTESDLIAVAATITALGRRAHIVPADLGDTAACAGLAAEAVEMFGKLDIVVNNVGGAMPKPLLDTTPHDLSAAFDFNVGTAHALTAAAVPHLLNVDGGSILNITSAVGRMPGRAFAAYGAAKAALAHYTRISALDLSPRIRVNAIAPGSVLTSALDIVASNDDLRGQLESATPLRRLGDPDDVAAAALWLTSPAGSFITGKIIEIDGGLNTLNLVLPLPDL